MIQLLFHLRTGVRLQISLFWGSFRIFDVPFIPRSLNTSLNTTRKMIITVVIRDHLKKQALNRFLFDLPWFTTKNSFGIIWKMVENVGREVQKINVVVTTLAVPHETTIGDIRRFKTEVWYLGNWIERFIFRIGWGTCRCLREIRVVLELTNDSRHWGLKWLNLGRYTSTLKKPLRIQYRSEKDNWLLIVWSFQLFVE